MGNEMCNRGVPLCLIFLIVILVVAQHAQSEVAVNLEIDHLLEYIENAGCMFVRNNTAYDGTKARAHIQKKYDYFKDRIKTTEDFIMHDATKSTMSGKLYKVRCDGREMLCAEWLYV